MTARTLIEMHRIEFHCPRRGQTTARGLEDLYRLWLKRRCGLWGWVCLGRGRLGLLFRRRGLPSALVVTSREPTQ